jgi:preprotein translocase subunit SecE
MSGMMKNIMQFLSEVRVELAKIEWPSNREWIGATIITLILVVIAALFLGVVDRTFSFVIRQIFNFVA